ncbi:MAG: acyltransferase [Prevotella sp.]|nr:acyltransferase [Prevotella sp.]
MKRYKKIYYTLRLMMYPGSGRAIANYIRKHHIFGGIGNNCMIQIRRLPIYPSLIFIHNNVSIAADVRFSVHDVIHNMLNIKYGTRDFVEKVGCIEIMDNVFVGAGSRILYNTRIGSNVIIGAGSFVNKDIPDNSVYAGVPAKYICSFDEYVEKAKKWSEDFVTIYGKNNVKGNLDNGMAERLYHEFLRERNGIL